MARKRGGNRLGAQPGNPCRTRKLAYPLNLSCGPECTRLACRGRRPAERSGGVGRDARRSLRDAGAPRTEDEPSDRSRETVRTPLDAQRQIGDEREVVGGAAGELVDGGVDVHDVELRRHENVVERPHGQE